MSRVACFQFDVRSGDPAYNLTQVEGALQQAADLGVALVVLPEMWATSFKPAPGEGDGVRAATALALDRLRELSAEHELCVLGSAFGPGPKPTNRLHAFEGGKLVLEYDKVHLFTPTAESEGFSAGDEAPATVDCAAGRLSGVVCYDLRFPEILRVPFRAGAEVIAVSAQWPLTRIDHWRQLLIARAIENRCFMIGTNRTGHEVIGRKRRRLEFPGQSLIVSPLGKVIAEAGAESQLLSAELDLREVRHYRTHIPINKDERPDLYARWLESHGSTPHS